VTGDAVVGADRVPVSRAAPARRRRPSRTHGACWAAAAQYPELTAPAATKAAPASASGWGPTYGRELNSEHEPGAMAPFTLTKAPSGTNSLLCLRAAAMGQSRRLAQWRHRRLRSGGRADREARRLDRVQELLGSDRI
jgi:hypothetical protein